MLSCFKPLRWKIGVVTLLVACVLMAGWLRSQSGSEFLYRHWEASGIRWQVLSSRGELLFARIGNHPNIYWRTRPYVRMRPDEFSVNQWLEGIEFKQNFQRFGIRIGTVNKKEVWVSPGSMLTADMPVQFFTVPYWFIVIPLTLLSAWLLLSTPRKTNRGKMAEPVSPETL